MWGQVSGVIPEFLLAYQNGTFHFEQQMITKDMHERKARMYALVDGFLALLGGIVPLEQLLEIMTWSQLEQHTKPMFLLNVA